MRFTLNYSKGGKREAIFSSQGWKGKGVKNDESDLKWGISILSRYVGCS